MNQKNKGAAIEKPLSVVQGGLEMKYNLDAHWSNRKELSLNQKNKGAAIEKPLFVVQGCLEMICKYDPC